MKLSVERIEIERLRKGWTKQRLAREVGCSMSTVSRLEQVCSASPRVIKRLAEVFDVDVADILVHG